MEQAYVCSKAYPKVLNGIACVLQVSFAVNHAFRQGIKNQLVEFPLPVGEAHYGIMGDSQGFAGGVSESFRAARPTVERFLMSLKQQDGLQASSFHAVVHHHHSTLPVNATQSPVCMHSLIL